MSKQQDADLILKLYDLRREATMREARNWMFTFNPTSVQDVIEVLLSDHSGHYIWSFPTGTWLQPWSTMARPTKIGLRAIPYFYCKAFQILPIVERFA